jgi:protein-S-isoprenylcysteine O-methyltransferase Ste14
MVKKKKMSKSKQRKRTERAEFWGTTPASLLATIGIVVSVLSALYVPHTWLSFCISLLGLGAIILALWIDWRKGLDVKWRKVNFILHALLLLVSVVTVAIRLYFGRPF